jgi:hypothetical protein
LCFDFYFIPPYGTFQIGSLEGWLLLFLFIAASVAVVGRVVRFFSSARKQEQDTAFLVEMVALVGSLPGREDIAQLLAERIQQYYRSAFVKVNLYQRGRQPSVLKIRTAEGIKPSNQLPGRTLPILSGADLVGEISIAQASIPLPGDDDPLLQSVCRLAAIAVDREKSGAGIVWTDSKGLQHELQA